MTQEQQLREARQALNEALNNHDLETSASFLHPDFIAKGTDGQSYDRQAAVAQLEQFLKPSMNFQSQIEVENVEVSGAAAKLRVRRTESARVDNPRHFWTFLAVAVFVVGWTGWTIYEAARDELWQMPVQYWGGIATVVCGLGVTVLLVWVAFRWGLRSMHQTQSAEETWRCVDGRWLLAEEQQVS